MRYTPRKIIGFADAGLIERLDGFKDTKGLKSRTSALATLLNEASQTKELPPATFESVFADTRPMVIAGASGSGKTTTTKKMLEHFSGPVFVLDTSREYGFQSIEYSSVAGITWASPARYSCLLSQDTDVSRIEANLVFRSIGLAAHRGQLREWTLVVEEAHRFSGDFELKALLLEARKLCRKLLILTAEPEPFEKLAPVFSPGNLPQA